MVWSNYINYEYPHLIRPTAGIEALIMAINERCDAFGGYGRIELKKLTQVSNAVFTETENTLNYLATRFLKSEFAKNPENCELDPSYNRGLTRVNYNNTWYNTANVCEYLSEEEIKYNIPISTKFSAKWLAQKIKIVNLFTVAIYLPANSTNNTCVISGENEEKAAGAYTPYWNEYNHDELFSLALSNIENPYYFQTSNYFVSIASYCNKGYTMGGGGTNTRQKFARVFSARTKIYNAESKILQSYDIVIIAKPTVPAVNFPDSPPVYDTNNSDWIEDKSFVLLRSRAEKGVMQKSDWFGYSSFYPQPVDNPGYTEELNYYNTNARGFKLDCAAVIDFAVPGGFEFIEETEN
jgi:hypothetical protein